MHLIYKILAIDKEYEEAASLHTEIHDKKHQCVADMKTKNIRWDMIINDTYNPRIHDELKKIMAHKSPSIPKKTMLALMNARYESMPEIALSGLILANHSEFFETPNVLARLIIAKFHPEDVNDKEISRQIETILSKRNLKKDYKHICQRSVSEKTTAIEKHYAKIMLETVNFSSVTHL
jgi:hypothetical protein